MSDQHQTCEDPGCATCQDRLRLAALDIERGLRPAGRLMRAAARVKANARSLKKHALDNPRE